MSRLSPDKKVCGFNLNEAHALWGPRTTDALGIALAASELSQDSDGEKLTFFGDRAINYVNLARSAVTIINMSDPSKRIPTGMCPDHDVAAALVLELRTAVTSYAYAPPYVTIQLPRRVFETNMPSSRNIKAAVSKPPNFQIHPLDAAAAAFGIQTHERPFHMPPNIDLASLMRDPKELGKFLSEAVTTLNELPKLRAQIDDAHKVAQIATVKAESLALVVTERETSITDLEARLKEALTRASTGSVSTPNPAGQTNDLASIARAMHITLDQLKAELDSFVATCALPLPNAVRWPTWCDPTDRSSPLPFCYRHSKPVFLAGESGTGKTFIAEALCMLEAGRRCAVTFHEKISYNKLFVRETVDNGKVRSVLGPVLLSLLTGTPIVLDEIDHADIFVQSLMHEVLDKRRVFIPELAISIVAEQGCRFIATGNSLTDDSGQYHGDVGTALRTRFAAIHVEYPDEQIETDTVATASGCTKKLAETIARVFKALRTAVIEQKIAGPISVRESCAAGLMAVQGLADKLTEDQALALGLGLMVVQKRPPQEQLVAAEICATVAKVPVGAFQNKVAAAGQRAQAKAQKANSP
jgi:hypothetical protein